MNESLATPWTELTTGGSGSSLLLFGCIAGGAPCDTPGGTWLIGATDWPHPPSQAKEIAIMTTRLRMRQHSMRSPFAHFTPTIVAVAVSFADAFFETMGGTFTYGAV